MELENISLTSVNSQQEVYEKIEIEHPYDFALIYQKKNITQKDIQALEYQFNTNYFGTKIIQDIKKYENVSQNKTQMEKDNEKREQNSKNKKVKKNIVFLKYVNAQQLLLEAEKMKIEKIYYNEKFQKNTTYQQEKSSKFINILKSKSNSKKERLDNFQKVLKDIDPRIQLMEKYKKFNYQNKHMYHQIENKDGSEVTDLQILENVFSNAEILMFKYQKLMQIKQTLNDGSQVNMIEYQQDSHNLIDVIPLHDDQELNKVKSKEEIRHYFGENISFYFEFLGFFQKWLIPPIILGVGTELLDHYYLHADADSSPFEAIYAFLIVIWASVFYTKWKQHEKSTRTLYRSFGKNFKLQQKFHHYDHKELETKLDKVTGEEFQYFPVKKRILKYLQFGLYSLPIIGFTIYFLIASLNVRGLIDQDHTALKIDFFADLGAPGGIFDTNGSLAFVPNLLHVVIVSMINAQYMKLVVKTTKSECHETKYKFQDSIITKRFIFEFFSYFTDLFYLAFINFDILALKNSLIALYSFDEVRRVLTETIIPLIKNYGIQKHVTQQQTQNYINQYIPGQLKKTDNQNQNQNQNVKTPEINEQNIKNKISEENYIAQKLCELEKPKYEPFDDYIEIIMNFGYLTLFASAFTLAPLWIFVFNLIEYHSDKFKIVLNYQRPIPQKSKGISSWNHVLNAMTLICVFTNIILFAFSSDQMAEVFPTFFVSDQPVPTFNSFLESLKHSVHEHTSNFGNFSSGMFFNQNDQPIDPTINSGLIDFDPNLEQPIELEDNHESEELQNLPPQLEPLVGQKPAQGMARYVVAIIFAIEHVMFGLIWIIRKFLNSKRDWTDIYQQRKAYFKKIK